MGFTQLKNAQCVSAILFCGSLQELLEKGKRWAGDTVVAMMILPENIVGK